MNPLLQELKATSIRYQKRFQTVLTRCYNSNSDYLKKGKEKAKEPVEKTKKLELFEGDMYDGMTF